jgi:acid ceramidase
MLQEISVDLKRRPSDRWHLTPTQRGQARELLKQYKTDFGLPPDLGEVLISGSKQLIRNEHWQEMESLASEVSVPVRDVALCNCYYDAMKLVLGNAFGCTAFAIDTPDAPLHARNLDWWTENSALAEYSAACHFEGAPAGRFTTVGWPGFVGAFSGIAPGRFAISLNAVLSLEPAQFAMPIELLLRTVLEESPSFARALALLSESPLPCDCLLLLTGTKPGELVVIERTPSRYAIRGSQDGFVCVANGYQSLDTELGKSPLELLATCCRRFDRINALIRVQRPRNSEDCFAHLSDPEVQMNMTVQQMVFRAATGERWTRSPQPF